MLQSWAHYSDSAALVLLLSSIHKANNVMLCERTQGVNSTPSPTITNTWTLQSDWAANFLQWHKPWILADMAVVPNPTWASRIGLRPTKINIDQVVCNTGYYNYGWRLWSSTNVSDQPIHENIYCFHAVARIWPGDNYLWYFPRHVCMVQDRVDNFVCFKFVQACHINQCWLLYCTVIVSHQPQIWGWCETSTVAGLQSQRCEALDKRFSS